MPAPPRTARRSCSARQTARRPETAPRPRPAALRGGGPFLFLRAPAGFLCLRTGPWEARTAVQAEPAALLMGSERPGDALGHVECHRAVGDAAQVLRQIPDSPTGRLGLVRSQLGSNLPVAHRLPPHYEDPELAPKILTDFYPEHTIFSDGLKIIHGR